MPEVLVSGYLHTSAESAARRILDRLGRASGLDLRAATLTPRPGQPGELRFLLTVPWAETTARDAWFDLPARFASAAASSFASRSARSARTATRPSLPR